MRRFVLAALFLAPALAAGQGVVQSAITNSRISVASSARYVFVAMNTASLTVANGAVATVYMPWPGRLVDVITYQSSAGVGGTSYTVDVKTVAGTSLLTTLPVITLASGADKLTDVKSELSLPAGWTRGVLKTDATTVLTKGQKLSINTVETGAYSTHAGLWVALVIDPAR